MIVWIVNTNEQRWIRVNQNFTLGDVLRYQNYVIPGIPVFYIFANNSYDNNNVFIIIKIYNNVTLTNSIAFSCTRCKRDFYEEHEGKLLQLVSDTCVRSIHRCQRNS